MRMTTSAEILGTSRSSPCSENFSTAPTAADSVRSQPKCMKCRKIYRTLSEEDKEKWPPTKNLEKPCHGWPGLVNIMVKNPGFESFQAFRDLHIKSLLYYQAELVSMREEIHKIEWENHDHGGFDASEDLSVDAELLLQTACKGSTEGKESEQMLKVKEMRMVLKEYSEAMLLYTKVNDLPEPETFGVKSLLKWLKVEESYPIHGPGMDSWGELNTPDIPPMPLNSQFRRLVRTIFWEKETDKVHLGLVVPRKNKEVDGLTRWVYSEGVPFWEGVCGKWNPFWKDVYIKWNHFWEPTEGLPQWLSDLGRKVSNAGQITEKSENTTQEKTKIVTYRVKRLVAFTSFVTTVVASLLPIVAIVVLSKMHEQPMILGFIALFTGLFTMGLMILTPSGTSRTEIFTASAAFAAVMVVFVQNQTSGNGS